MTKMNYIKGNELTYAFCDDWLIFGVDKNGKEWFIITEMWPEWADLPENAAYEENAIEKYMVPVALKKWNRLTFERFADMN